MIITCKKEIPLRWIVFAILPWASYSFYGAVMGAVFFFSLKKFIENPAGLTFVLSLPGFLSLVLQPLVSFTSDRIWTRFGRRKPFIATSMIGVAGCLILMPLMPNFWALLAVFIVYHAFNDLNSPLEPFKQEIIPPQERGRATGAMSWCANLGTMTFYFIALGRFDDVSYMAGFPLKGETVIYWAAALLVIVMVLLVTLGIHEIDQKSALRGEPLSIKNFVGGLLDNELWPVYMLVVGAACLNFYAGLGTLSNLLYTDQWNYTKQEMGINVAVGGIINLFAIGFLTFFADRFNRMRAYQVLISMSLGCQILYYCYINFVLPDRHPTLVEIIIFGETISILGILTGLIYVPLVYDYVRRNKMGTFNAGAQVVTRLTVLITLNGVGLFVWGYAMLFQPPAGEMTRVVLSNERTARTDLLATLRAATWTSPKDGTTVSSSDIDANAWQANGKVTNVGRCWEVRLRDKASETLAAQKASLEAENSPLVADEKRHRDNIADLQGKGQTYAAEEKLAADERTRMDAITARIKDVDAELSSSAVKFQDQVAKVLGNRLIADGDQVTGATAHVALLLDLPATRRPDEHQVEKIIARLSQERSDVIDLRPLKRYAGYGLEVSAIEPPHGDQIAFERDLQKALEEIADKMAPALIERGAIPLAHSHQPALILGLMLVEDPVDNYVSPVTRVVNAVLGLFNDPPDPKRRLVAMARNLRLPAETNHVRVEPGTTRGTLSITVVFPPTAERSKSVDVVTARLSALLLPPDASAGIVPQARQLYDRVQTAAAVQHLTVARPTLASAYAPMKYDYMSGYLWMFFMGSIGIFITHAFGRLEAKGLIRKRGIEEMRQS